MGRERPDVAVKESDSKRIYIMLNWALSFLILALVAAVLGFGGIAAGASEIAKILFFVFLVMFIVSFFINATRGKPLV